MTPHELVEKLAQGRISGPEFAQLMENYGIRPRDLGISPNYKARLKKGDRQPSRDLQLKLLQLIQEKTGVTQTGSTMQLAHPYQLVAARSRLGGAAGPRGPQEFDTGFDSDGVNGQMGLMGSQMTETPPVKSPHVTVTLGVTQSVSQLVAEIARAIPQLLPGFREYVYSRFSKVTARHDYNYVARHGAMVLMDPAYISRLTYKQAKHLLLGLAALRDYLALLGFQAHAEALDSYLKQLRKLAPRQTRVKLFEYELDKPIIEKALEEVERILASKAAYTTKLAALTAFFTGLREPEIVYLLQNYPRLRKIEEDGTIIVELGLDRKSKKAWVTILPKELAELIHKIHVLGLRVGSNLVKDARDRHGLHVSIHRKAHAAILGAYMSENEIKLLQGKVGEIMVKHYTKHLRELAKRYLEAYRPYIERLRSEWVNLLLLAAPTTE